VQLPPLTAASPVDALDEARVRQDITAWEGLPEDDDVVTTEGKSLPEDDTPSTLPSPWLSEVDKARQMVQLPPITMFSLVDADCLAGPGDTHDTCNDARVKQYVTEWEGAPPDTGQEKDMTEVIETFARADILDDGDIDDAVDDEEGAAETTHFTSHGGINGDNADKVRDTYPAGKYGPAKSQGKLIDSGASHWLMAQDHIRPLGRLYHPDYGGCFTVPPLAGRTGAKYPARHQVAIYPLTGTPYCGCR